MKKVFYLFIGSLAFLSCQKEYDAPIPDQSWEQFESPSALPLTALTQNSMEGVYSVTEGADIFGDQVAIKWSSVIRNSDTVYHVSVFCGKDIAYFICEGKSLDSSILLNGYWRKMINVETGRAQFTISYIHGARQLLSANPVIAKDSIVIEGVFGDGEQVPEKKIVFRYNRPLHARNGFQILAHRGGGRTSDYLGVSENSVEMILKTEQFGSTGIEIDVRLTSDGIPVLYHDNTLNLRLIKANGMVGPIENYSYAQLSGLVRLINGERIPTLQEALDAVIYNTSLEYVWLDTKYDGDLNILKDIQAEYLQKAAVAGRSVEILIGLPTDIQFNNFLQFPNYTSVPSLCELSVDQVRQVNAKVWGPRWTLGTQNAEVDQMHSEGRKVFTWTMDVPSYIQTFLAEGQFDGILTNYPTIVAYHEYVR